MYPQNPYQPGQTPQQPPQAPLDDRPATLSHSGPVVPLYPQQSPSAPAPAPNSAQQPVQPGTPVAPYPQPATPQATPAPLSSAQFPDVQPPSDFPVDYLDQIAPQQQKTVNKFAVFGLIGGIITATIVAFVLLTSTGNEPPAAQMQQALDRINTLQKVASAQQRHLTENDLSQANATLDSALGSMATDLTALMKSKGVKVSTGKSTKTAKAEVVYLAALQKKLDDAYQRGRLDRNYTSQMRYELTILDSKLTKLRISGKSKSITEFCTAASANIAAILRAYDAYDANTAAIPSRAGSLAVLNL